MIIKYEKISSVDIDGEQQDKIEELVDDKDATHVHICRHDTGQSCNRITKTKWLTQTQEQ